MGVWINKEDLVDAIEHLDWHSLNEKGDFHEGAPNEESAYVRYKEVETAISKAASLETVPGSPGCWIPRNPNNPDSQHYCSECKSEVSAVKAKYHKFCYECGADMRGPAGVIGK